MVRVAVGTGLRRGEVLNLQWGDVDVGAGRLVVRNREASPRRTAPSEPCRSMGTSSTRSERCERRGRRPERFRDQCSWTQTGTYRIGSPSGSSSTFARRSSPTGKELSFHSCRHTTGSWLSMQGVPLRVISETLGHSNTQ
ncbi:MAG: site-specific integrase, partial [Salinibacter sp.]